MSSKDTAAETRKKMRTGAVVWRTMANWYLMKNKPQHPGVSQAHSVMNLASAFIVLSMCNLCAASTGMKFTLKLFSAEVHSSFEREKQS